MSKLAFVHEWEALLEASRELILMLRSEEDGEKPTPTLTCLGDFLIVDGSGFAYDHLKSAEAFLVHCIVWTAKCLLGFENVRRDSTTEFCYEIGINQPFLSKKTQYGTSAIGSWVNIHTPTTVHITKEAHVPEPVLENIEDCEIMFAGVCNYYDRLMAKMVEHYPDDQHPIYWELYPELRKQKTGQLPTNIELTHSGLVVNFKAPEQSVDLDAHNLQEEILEKMGELIKAHLVECGLPNDGSVDYDKIADDLVKKRLGIQGPHDSLDAMAIYKTHQETRKEGEVSLEEHLRGATSGVVYFDDSFSIPNELRDNEDAVAVSGMSPVIMADAETLRRIDEMFDTAGIEIPEAWENKPEGIDTSRYSLSLTFPGGVPLDMTDATTTHRMSELFGSDLDKEIHIGRGHSEPFHVLGDGIVISGVFPDDPNETGKIVDIEEDDQQE